MYVKIYISEYTEGDGEKRRILKKQVFDGWVRGSIDSAEEKAMLELLKKDPPGVVLDRPRENWEALRREGALTAELIDEAKIIKFVDLDGELQTDVDIRTGDGQRVIGCAMLVLMPGERPYRAVIPDKLSELQRSVGGYIEITYPFDDNCLVVGNDEAKLIGMEGNRRINGQIYAGPLLLAGDDYLGGFCDLTPAQIQKYEAQFRKPEQITGEEVEKSIRFEVFAV